MGTVTKPAVPGWATQAWSLNHPWERTPIWDSEFAERWDALHRELTEPEQPPARPARKPRTPRKTTTK
jgi:hypothetical protein